MKKPSPGTICQNRRARFDYAIEDTFEAGLSLTGSEVKSVRAGNAQINESYASFSTSELWLINAHIAPYEHAGYAQHDPRRSRKLLMHRRELEKLRQAVQAKGQTLVPLRLYWSRGLVKAEIALAQGKKHHDKRQAIKERDWNREKQKLLKHSR